MGLLSATWHRKSHWLFLKNRLQTTEVTVPSQLLNISPGRAATVEKVVVKPAERFYPSATMLLQRKDLCKTCNLAGM